MDTKTNTITITVDGKTVECRPGELLIEVAKRAGIYIPFFCYHPRMDPVGACRMCLVNVQPGPPKPQASCTTRVADGMVVKTQFTDPDVKRAQEGMLEFLLINHPLDCPICDRGGECPLQDQTQDYGPSESRYLEPKRRFEKPVSISPLIKLDRERCILCYRCTRFCEELSGDTLIGVMERGPSAFIFPFEGEDFDSYFSGNTVQICPVGALTSTEYRFQSRPWDLQLVPTTCNMCASGCSMHANVRVQDGKVVRFTGATNEETNEEWLCDKGRYGHAYISGPQRLTQPMIRSGEHLVDASWDEAFRTLSERLAPTLAGGAAGLLVGASLPDEDSYTAQKFARLVLGTNSVDHRLEGGMEADGILPPRLTYDDVLTSDRVVLVSFDAREELPLVFLRLRIAATKRNVRVVVVHPRAVGLTELAEHRIAPLPGTETAVAAALTAALGRPIAAGVEAMAAAAGVPASDVVRLGELLGDGSRTTIVLGPRVATDANAMRAWRAVGAACGASVGWAPRGAGEYGALASGAHPGLLPGWRAVADATARDEVEAAWGASVPSEPGLGAGDLLKRAVGGGLECLWLVGADPLNDVPDANLGGQALSMANFVVVQDVQRSQLLDMADVVLPAATFVERDGTLTDWEGRRQPTRTAVEPPGSARADYAILAEAARRAGRPIGCRTIADVRTELEPLLRTPPTSDADTAVHTRELANDPQRPFRLLTYRLLYDGGSRVSRTEGIRALTPDGYAEIHPSDAEQLGIGDGTRVRVSSTTGAITVQAKVSEGIRPGVVFVPYAQPMGSARELLTWGESSPPVKVERA
jgi:NADH-quinone oxidoreductase subunit G